MAGARCFHNAQWPCGAFPIAPMPALRKNRGSKYTPAKSADVRKYEAWKKEVALARNLCKIPPNISGEALFGFIMPAPNSALDRWGKLHQQKPDVDNLIKAAME